MRTDWEQHVVELLDVLEDPPPKTRGCNAKTDKGERCGRLVVEVRGGTFGMLRLCASHREPYRVHDVIVRNIRSIPVRGAI